MDMRRVVGLAVLAGSIGVLALYLTIWAHLPSLDARGSDFSASYVAGQLWLDHPYSSNLYNQTLENSAHQLLLPPHAVANLPFVSPPLAAVLAAPFTWLNLDIAYRLFSLIQLALVAAACVIAARFAPWPESTPKEIKAAVVAAAIAGVGTAAVFWLGQWDGVIALTLALGYGAVRAKQEGKSGAWLTAGLALVKPHLAIGTTCAAIGLWSRRFVVAAATTSIAIAAVSVVAVGPSTAWNFLGALLFESGHTPGQSTLGYLGLMTSVGLFGANSVLPYVIPAVLGSALICIYLGTALWREPEVVLAGTIAFSLAISPHTLPHDLVLLSPIFVGVAAKELRSRNFPILIGLWVALNLAALIDLGNTSIGFPGRLVPWVLIAIGLASYLVIKPQQALRPAKQRQPE